MQKRLAIIDSIATPRGRFSRRADSSAPLLADGIYPAFGPARNGFRALHPCTISALAMLLDTILPTSKTIDPLAWDGIVYAALTGGASKAVFDEELPQLFGCGDWTRTSDLRLMRPTSFHLLHSAT